MVRYQDRRRILLPVVATVGPSVLVRSYDLGSPDRTQDNSEVPLFDGQGSERTVTNGSQTVVGTLNLDGFGNTVDSTGSSNPYMHAATSGYRNDGDAGLTHVGARYYDAQVGRFITRDTYLDQAAYLYCEHNPVNALDPSGHFWWILVIILLAVGTGGCGNPTPQPLPRIGPIQRVMPPLGAPPDVRRGTGDGFGSDAGRNLMRRSHQMDREDHNDGTGP